MSNSRKTLLTDYINVFAITSLNNFKWCYKELFSRSLFMTLIDLKNSKELNNEYVLRAEQIIQNNPKIYMVIGMSFVNKVHGQALTEALLENKLPSRDAVFMYNYDETIDETKEDIVKQNDKDTSQAFFKTIDSMKMINIVYCWNFLSAAKSRDLVDKVSEEYLLLKEIALFKKTGE